MSKKMLIDATHPEETRVVVVEGSRVEDFDYESINKRQLAGNIYLAKVTRVEPSLQAAFVDYGGNRHGFLAFSEIHPDYYQIPKADREALLAAEAAEDDAEDEASDDKPAARAKAKSRRAGSSRRRKGKRDDDGAQSPAETEGAESAGGDAPSDETAAAASDAAESGSTAETAAAPDAGEADAESPLPDAAPEDEAATAPADDADASDDEPDGPRDPKPGSIAESAGTDGETVAEDYAPDAADGEAQGEASGEAEAETGSKPKRRRSRRKKADAAPETAAPAAVEAATEEIGDSGAEKPESVAAEAVEDEVRPRRVRARQYKIQEVIKVRQILLVQVVKEERGNKGAALTTYLSLAGRYCVLMPNTARGGGISRKITNAADRKKLKDIAGELEVPKGMGLIIRTAGSQRTRTEIKRDYEFLLRQWEQVRELTLQSVAPTLIYEEGSLIKRSIRDLYSKDIDEILVEGEDGYREAKDYMRMLMPSHAKNVQPYRDPIPLFSRHQVESYLSSMFNPTVQLKSGGYIVIGVTEALVAIDVNSGRSTREGSIEETALKTNLEAADEVARQLRLRDLAGLIVIDFIDMDDRRNNAAVERRMKDKLKNDRARIQLGRISAFGLMEMSRQRLRPGMLEASTAPCSHCHGTGTIRSAESLALSILREVEEEGVRRRASEVKVTAPVAIANFIMNRKRDHVAAIELRYDLQVMVEGDPALVSPDYKVERIKAAAPQPQRPQQAAVRAESAYAGLDDPRGPEEEGVEEAEIVEEKPAPKAKAPAAPAAETDEEAERARAKRRRGRRGGRKRKRRDDEGEERGADGDPMPVFGDDGEADGGPMSVEAGPFGDEIGAPDTAPQEADARPTEAAVAEPATPPEPVREPVHEPESAAPEPEPEPAPLEAAAPEAEPEAQPAVEAAAQADDAGTTAQAEPAAAPEPDAEPKPDRPKRKGWWSIGA